MVSVKKAALISCIILSLTGCELFNSGPKSPHPNKTPILWSMNFNDYSSSPSFVSNNLIGGYDIYNQFTVNQFTVIDLDKREKLWHIDNEYGGVDPLLITSNGEHWFVTNNAHMQLEVLDNSGKLVYVFDYSVDSDQNISNSYIAPIVSDTTLYANYNQSIYAFDISKPKETVLLWSKELPNKISSLSLAGLGLYVGLKHSGEDSDNIYKLSKNQGERLWSATSFAKTDSEHYYPVSFAFRGNRVFVQGGTSMKALNMDTGQEIWLSEEILCDEYPVFGFGYSQILDESSIYSGRSTCLISISQENGKLNWIFEPNSLNDDQGGYNPFGKGIALYKDVIYATNDFLWAIEAETGEILSRSNRYNSTLSSHVHIYKDQVIIWGEKLLAYKPVR